MSVPTKNIIHVPKRMLSRQINALRGAGFAMLTCLSSLSEIENGITTGITALRHVLSSTLVPFKHGPSTARRELTRQAKDVCQSSTVTETKERSPAWRLLTMRHLNWKKKHFYPFIIMCVTHTYACAHTHIHKHSHTHINTHT